MAHDIWLNPLSYPQFYKLYDGIIAKDLYRICARNGKRSILQIQLNFIIRADISDVIYHIFHKFIEYEEIIALSNHKIMLNLWISL